MPVKAMGARMVSDGEQCLGRCLIADHISFYRLTPLGKVSSRSLCFIVMAGVHTSNPHLRSSSSSSSLDHTLASSWSWAHAVDSEALSSQRQMDVMDEPFMMRCSPMSKVGTREASQKSSRNREQPLRHVIIPATPADRYGAPHRVPRGRAGDSFLLSVGGRGFGPQGATNEVSLLQ